LPSQSKKLKIGITGGLGSGKTSASKFLISQGFPVFFADEIAKSLMTTDPLLVSQIIDNFGSESYLDGKLNTSYLGQKVFSSPELVQKLNSIVHPVVVLNSTRIMDEALKKNDIVFYEAALLLEAGMVNRFDYILLITAEEERRVDRALERGGISEDEIRRRIKSQISEEEKINKSHFVIENNSSVETLHTNLLILLNILKSTEKINISEFPFYIR
jgi:dephospho-CoA kinase